jgi:hypothetical protein
VLRRKSSTDVTSPPPRSFLSLASPRPCSLTPPPLFFSVFHVETLWVVLYHRWHCADHPHLRGSPRLAQWLLDFLEGEFLGPSCHFPNPPWACKLRGAYMCAQRERERARERERKSLRCLIWQNSTCSGSAPGSNSVHNSASPSSVVRQTLISISEKWDWEYLP